MKKLSILVPATAVVVLLSAMVIAAPRSGSDKATIAVAPDRAAAFQIATAD